MSREFSDKQNTFGQRVLDFYTNLEKPAVPDGIKVMNPHLTPEVRQLVRNFCNKFYNDNNKRVLVFGINPGRFGAGLTGITFTDPVVLEKDCGIPNNLSKKRELSAEFVYKFIEKWGGVKKFYRRFFLTAVSPLGYVKEGINFNYYDNPDLPAALEGFIVRSIQKQLKIGGSKKAAIILGRGKNKKYFDKLNQKYKFFDKVFGLDHPRFIMQYRREKINDYLQEYFKVFGNSLN
jgi:hypothetical protein